MTHLIRKTKDLPLIRRVLARLVSKAQKFLIQKEGNLAFKAYYRLAEIHFYLHFGFGLRTAIQCIGKSNISNATVLFAARRHARLFLNANPMIKEEGDKTLRFYKQSAEMAFIENLK